MQLTLRLVSPRTILRVAQLRDGVSLQKARNDRSSVAADNALNHTVPSKVHVPSSPLKFVSLRAACVAHASFVIPAVYPGSSYPVRPFATSSIRSSYGCHDFRSDCVSGMTL